MSEELCRICAGKLPPDTIFVFGSNLLGIHGAGAALHAKRKHGAQEGRHKGQIGRFAYALPTKRSPSASLSLLHIELHAKEFVSHAFAQTNTTFYVTRIGCGLAGYTDKDMAPLFADALNLPNVLLPEEWIAILNGEKSK